MAELVEGLGGQGSVLLWHRRHAMQLAMQLPDIQKDALLVTEALRDLIASWLPDDQPFADRPLIEARGEGVVLPFTAPERPLGS